MVSRKISSSKQLGDAIRARRKEMGYTQATIAAYAGCSTRFLSELERGKQTAEIEKTIQVIQTLGMDMGLLFRGA